MKECQITIIEDENQTTSPYQVYSDKERDLIGVGLEQSEFDPNDPNSALDLSVYDSQGNLVYNDPNFTEYNVTNDPNTKGGISTLNLDPGDILVGLGLAAGLFTTVFRFNKNQLGSSASNPLFFTQEISPNRQEIKVSSTVLEGDKLVESINEFSSSLAGDSSNFDDFYVNFGEDQQYIANNILLQDNPNNPTFLIHLYEPLPEDVELNDEFYIATQQADPLNLQVDLPYTNQLDDLQPTPGLYLQSANFNIPIKDVSPSPTDFQSLYDLINLPLTSSYNQLQNILEKKGITLNLDYTSFEKYVHFSSAKKRLENFYYKASLIESSSNQLNEKYQDINNPVVSSSRAVLENSITNIIKNFDGFENYLYFESTSLAWPKSNSTYPYTLYSTGSNEVLEWMGSDNPYSDFFGGRIASASEFDNLNSDALVKTIPEYLREDSNNEMYDVFINMLGQHFDNLYFYTQNVTDRFSGDNRLNFGISKDLVADALRNFGLKIYQNNFSSDDLYAAYLGISKDGSLLPPTGSEKITEYITGSSEVLPLNDVNKSTYKRLYHNLPYLLKKKGTTEGLRALITCFGIPDTILRISEFGGKDKIEDNDWDYFYRKYSKAFKISKQDNTYIKTPWLPLTSVVLKDRKWQVPSTVQFRFKTDGIPTPSNYSQSLWLLGTDHNIDNSEDFNVGLFLFYDENSIIEEQEYNGQDLTPSISGSLQLYISASGEYVKAGDISLPFFNQDWWSVQITQTPSVTTDNTNVSTQYKLIVKNTPYNGNDGTKIGFSAIQTYNAPSSLQDSVNKAWCNFSVKNSIDLDGNEDPSIPPSGYQPHASYGSRWGFGGNIKSISSQTLVNEDTYLSGAIQEIRYYSKPIPENVFDDYVMNPESVEALQLTGSESAFNILNFRAGVGNELLLDNNNTSGSLPPNLKYVLYNSIHPAVTASAEFLITSSFVVANPNDTPDSINAYTVHSAFYIRDDQEFPLDTINSAYQFDESYYIDQPVVGIKNRVTEKIKNISSSLYGEVLSPLQKLEQNYIASSSYTKDINYLEVAFSPQNEINDDIVAQLGYFDLGEYIGHPSLQSQSLDNYPNLEKLNNEYFEKYYKQYTFKDYIRLVKYFDNYLFKLIKDFTPVKTGLSSGVVIKQHLLERSKYPQPLVSSSKHEYTGSINTAFIKGGTGGAMDRYNGIPSESPTGGFLYSIKDNFEQKWSESYVGRDAVGQILHDSQNEFYNGEFSGSNIVVTTGDLNPHNPYKEANYSTVGYNPHLFSGANNRHVAESTFLNPNTIPGAGEVYLYFITSSIPDEITPR
jgi:hypothetical protein